jgi:2-aminoethylphosphonate-pyruvate transaminase
VKEAQIVEDICPREAEFGQVMHDISEGLLKIGNGSDSHHVALFGASGTGAMEATLVSALGENDHALILTNGAYGFRMQSICQGYKIKNSSLFEFGDYPDLDLLSSTLQNGDYTHLIVVHHETSTGMMNPLKEIVELCHSVGVKVIVDAMSSFGAYPINLSELGIDYLFSSSNKGIHGFAGLSFVLFHKERMDDLKKNGRAFYFDVFKQWENLQKKNQLRFTPPVQTCYAFKEAINETLEEGVENRRNRYTANWQILFDGFKEMGFKPFLKDEHQSKILLALDIDDAFDFNGFHDYLFKNGITIYPGVIPESNTFRISVIGDLYPEDMNYVVEKAKVYFS